MKHSDFLEGLRVLMLERGKEAFLKYLFTQFPFMSLPLLNPIVVKLVSLLVEKMYVVLDLEVYSKYVDFRADTQGKEFVGAMTEYLLARDLGKDVTEELARVKKTFDKLVVINV